MPVGLMFHDRGSGRHPTKVTDELTKTKQDLMESRLELKKATDQVSCLITLIRRSWKGDNSATIHLANIVGLPPGEFSSGNTRHTVSANAKSKAVENWERLSVKLLDSEYGKLQAEIMEQQKVYIESRNLYLDELINSHQESMSQYPARKSRSTINDVDNKFFNEYNKYHIQRPESAKTKRVKSAIHVRARPKTAKDLVKNADLALADLFIQPVKSSISAETQLAFTGLYKLGPEKKEPQPEAARYTDHRRYSQNNLFDGRTVVGPNKKVRPCSAVEMKARDERRSRPKSAGTYLASDESRSRPRSGVFITNRQEQPLKYEGTRPVSGKPIHKTEPIKNEPEGNSPGNENQNNSYDLENQESYDNSRKVEKVNLFQRRPQFIDEFSNDLKKMSDMEEQFKKTALKFQKRLGIPDSGAVY